MCKAFLLHNLWSKNVQYCQHVVTWFGKKDLSIIIQHLVYAVCDEICLPCAPPMLSTQPPTQKHSHILHIFSIAFIIHCFWPSKSNGLLLCTFLSLNSNGVQYTSPKVSNCWDQFVFIYLFSNPSFLGSFVNEIEERQWALTPWFHYCRHAWPPVQFAYWSQ